MTEHVPRSILITGGAGFIGSHLAEHLLAVDDEVELVVLDILSYAGLRENLQQAEGPRCHFVHGDICDRALVDDLLRVHRIDTVVHLAAESHVDRSIDDPGAFLRTNVTGTFTLLEACRAAWKGRTDVRFHHVSTDEVFGSLGPSGTFREDSPYDPSSPYSASKAASDHLVRAWQRTYALPVTISNCSNNYGPRQFPEKLLPLMIAKALAGEPLPVYGDGRQVRDWLYVGDHCQAIATILRHGATGRTYNVGGRCERENLRVVELLCDLLEDEQPCSRPGGYRQQITFVTDRPGHDRRYAIDCTRIEQELGWRPATDLDAGLRQTLRWYLDHPDWSAAVARRAADACQRRGLSGALP